MIEQAIANVVGYLKDNIPFEPEAAIILGSGLNECVEEAKIEAEISYADIPGIIPSTVRGHKGRLVFARAGGVKTVYMQGRLHCYEGHSPDITVVPLWALIKCGVKRLLCTCAVGGINPEYSAGDLVLVTDHINFTGLNPLTGKSMDSFGECFCNMSKAYSPALNQALNEEAAKRGIELKKGVYAYMHGPSFETPAEIRALRILGADMVGMSLVMEIIAARHAQIEACAVACVTNMAAGLTDNDQSHDEVMEEGKKSQYKMRLVIESFIAVCRL